MSGSRVAREVAPARLAAFDILLKLAQTCSAHSDTLLRSHAIDRLEEADRHLATALVMGTLRWQPAIEAHLRPLLARRAKLDLPIAIALRLGAFQLLMTDRIPAYAAIGDSVELAKRAGHRYASGMVNAVLRRVHREANGSPLTAEAAHPEWMRSRWSHNYGAEAAAAICSYDQQQPAITVRVPDAAREREMAGGGVALSPATFLTRARVVEHTSRERSAGAAADGFRLQDEGSQLVAELAGTGSRILDCCAAPGGKTAILAERNPKSRIVACEISAGRLREMRAYFASDPRTAAIEAIEADARMLGELGEFDLILCDVPCSGTGTLARNPEIKLRLAPEEPGRQAERQRALLGEALRHLAPGGHLLYATCSLEPEENEDVVRSALGTHPGIAKVPMERRIAELEDGGALHAAGARMLRERGVWDGFLRTLPGVLPCDGFFAASLTRP